MQIKFLYHSENSVRPFTYGFRFVVRIGLNFVLSYTPLERFTETLYRFAYVRLSRYLFDRDSLFVYIHNFRSGFV